MSTLTTNRAASAPSLKQAMNHHPLIAFFALAYAGTWLLLLPLLLGANGLVLQPHLCISKPESLQPMFVVTASCSCLVSSPPERPSHRLLHWRRC